MRDTLCRSVCVTQPEKQLQCLVAQRRLASARRGETLASKQTSTSLLASSIVLKAVAKATEGNFFTLIMSALILFIYFVEGLLL